VFRWADEDRRRVAVDARAEREAQTADREVEDVRVQAKLVDEPEDAWVTHPTAVAAATACDFSSHQKVYRCVTGKVDSVDGYVFRWVDDDRRRAAVDARAEREAQKVAKVAEKAAKGAEKAARRSIWGSGSSAGHGAGARTSPQQDAAQKAKAQKEKMYMELWKPRVTMGWNTSRRGPLLTSSPFPKPHGRVGSGAPGGGAAQIMGARGARSRRSIGVGGGLGVTRGMGGTGGSVGGSVGGGSGAPRFSASAVTTVRSHVKEIGRVGRGAKDGGKRNNRRALTLPHTLLP